MSLYLTSDLDLQAQRPRSATRSRAASPSGPPAPWPPRRRAPGRTSGPRTSAVLWTTSEALAHGAPRPHAAVDVVRLRLRAQEVQRHGGELAVRAALLPDHRVAGGHSEQVAHAIRGLRTCDRSCEPSFPAQRSSRSRRILASCATNKALESLCGSL